MLVTSILSFSHSVFYSYEREKMSFKQHLWSANAFNSVASKILSFGKMLILFQTSPGFLRVCSTGLLKTLWKKEILLITSNFSFSHSVFYPFGELSAIFVIFQIVVCKLICKKSRPRSDCTVLSRLT